MTGPPAETTLMGSSWRTDLFDVPAYLEAIGAGPAAPAGPSPERLAALHAAHVRTLPFANVDVLLGTHPGVEPHHVQDQLVRRRRGGYCFEHAQIFAAALEYEGFAVRRALGRVHSRSNTRTHMTVLVELGGRWWLCDPGFGFSLTAPIPLEDGAEREEYGRALSVARVDDDGTGLWALMRAGSVEHYIDPATIHPADVRTGHLVTSTDPLSHFTTGLAVMRHTDRGHVTITERARTVRPPDAPTDHAELGVDEVVAAVQTLGVALAPGEDALLAEATRRIRGDG